MDGRAHRLLTVSGPNRPPWRDSTDPTPRPPPAQRQIAHRGRDRGGHRGHRSLGTVHTIRGTFQHDLRPHRQRAAVCAAAPSLRALLPLACSLRRHDARRQPRHRPRLRSPRHVVPHRTCRTPEVGIAPSVHRHPVCRVGTRVHSSRADRDAACCHSNGPTPAPAPIPAPPAAPPPSSAQVE